MGSTPGGEQLFSTSPFFCPPNPRRRPTPTAEFLPHEIQCLTPLSTPLCCADSPEWRRILMLMRYTPLYHNLQPLWLAKRQIWPRDLTSIMLISLPPPVLLIPHRSPLEDLSKVQGLCVPDTKAYCGCRRELPARHPHPRLRWKHRCTQTQVRQNWQSQQEYILKSEVFHNGQS